MGFGVHRLTAAFHTARARSRNQSFAVARHLPLVFSGEDEKSHSRIGRRWHGGEPHHHHHPRGGWKESDGIFKIGLAADIGLAAGKALTGYVSGSTAIIADAAHSISDVVLSGMALWSFRAARAPKDDEHPYGHAKFETLGALGISCMLLASAGGIAWHALHILHDVLISTPTMIKHSMVHNHEIIHAHGGHHHGVDLEHPLLALSMTIISISVKEGLYWITKRAGDKEGSGLMKANAWHHRVDAVSSVVALVGVGGAIIGMRFLDPLAGLMVSGMILKAGMKSGYESLMELVDAGVPLPVLAPVKHTICDVQGVKGCHQLRGRKAGSALYLDVHIEVDPFLSVSAAHDIGENVRQHIQKHHREVAEVFIHIDPSITEFSDAIPDQRKNLVGMSRNSSYRKKSDAEATVSNILSSHFPEKMDVEHIIHHSLQGKVFLQVQVSMSSDVLVRDAMSIAKEAEWEILKADSSISQVSIQLRLGEPTPQLSNCTM